jgi:hypothetical protein
LEKEEQTRRQNVLKTYIAPKKQTYKGVARGKIALGWGGES